MTITHKLKCWPDSFAAIKSGAKTWETRKDDRGFQIGDVVELQEFVPLPGAANVTEHPSGKYTGASVMKLIGHIRGGDAGLAPGYVILGLSPYDPPLQVGSTLHQKVIDLLCKGGRADELSQTVIDAVRLEDMKDKQPGDKVDDLGPAPRGTGGRSGDGGGSVMGGYFTKPPTRTVDGMPILAGEDRKIEPVTVDLDGGAGIGAELPRRQKTGPSPIPPDVYWSERNQSFYSQITGRNCGEDFYELWHDRCAEFPVGLTAEKTAAADRGQINKAPSLREVEDYKQPDPNDPRRPLTAHEHELLTILSEECAEVIIQISKLKRFGRIGVEQVAVDHQKAYYNIALLGLECGHVQHMLHVIQACELISVAQVGNGVREKGEKLTRYLQTRRDPIDENFREVE